jgi:hypothetical protein
MTTVTWEEVLKRTDLIGGDIESIENGTPYRGPIATIEAVDDMINFTSPWCARLTDQGWENWHITTSSVNKMIVPSDIGNGRLHFHIPFMGGVTIFPRTGSKLDPNTVKGLAQDWERLIAHYPQLGLDRAVAKRVLDKLCFPRTAVELSKLPVTANLRNLLNEFRNPSSKEEFLWFYIEAMTGEENVHEKPY